MAKVRLLTFYLLVKIFLVVVVLKKQYFPGFVNFDCQNECNSNVCFVEYVSNYKEVIFHAYLGVRYILKVVIR